MDIKEGCIDTIVEHNEVYMQKDANAGGTRRCDMSSAARVSTTPTVISFLVSNESSLLPVRYLAYVHECMLLEEKSSPSCLNPKA